MAEKILKSIKFPGLEDTYILPVTKDAEETSLIGNDLENNQALGIYSTALGRENIAGAKGYYIKNIDVSNKKIHLSTTECVPTFEANYNNGESIDLSAYEVGEYIDITAYGHYHWILCSTILEIGSGYITYASDIDDSSNKLTTGTVSYYFSVPSKPLSGIVVFANTAFAEGRSNIAAGQFSHVEGYGNISTGRYSHAEGFGTLSGYNSHAEGEGTKAIGFSSHAEGLNTRATGYNAHAEGSGSKALGASAHAEGINTTASGAYSHAQGNGSVASGERAHAEGFGTQSIYADTHAEGFRTTAGRLGGGQGAHAEGINTVASGKAAHAEGYDVVANGAQSHAEGFGTKAISRSQHVQGEYNEIDTTGGENSRGTYAVIVGNGDSDSARSNAYTLDWEGNAKFAGTVESGLGRLLTESEVNTKLTGYATESYVNTKIDEIEVPQVDLTNYATKNYVDTHYVNAGQKSGVNIGNRATAEGQNTQSTGDRTHAEGFETQALYADTHAEGFRTVAGQSNDGQGAHAEGNNTKALGSASHAEGNGTTASGKYSHAEGLSTKATGERAHAEGISTTASGVDSHTEGFFTTASAQGAHAEGNYTIADKQWQHVQGKYNETGNFAHIVGNGSGENVYDEEGNLITKKRSNAHTLDWDGNAWFAGSVYVGGTAQSSEATTIEGYDGDEGNTHFVVSYPRLPQVFFGTVDPNNFYNDNGQINLGQDGDIYIMIEE